VLEIVRPQPLDTTDGVKIAITSTWREGEL